MYVGPAVYVIHCKKSDKYYIGETDNICERTGIHYKQFMRNKHMCQELQKYPKRREDTRS